MSHTGKSAGVVSQESLAKKKDFLHVVDEIHGIMPVLHLIACAVAMAEETEKNEDFIRDIYPYDKKHLLEYISQSLYWFIRCTEAILEEEVYIMWTRESLEEMKEAVKKVEECRRKKGDIL
ncbi:MAG TPA: hypothetical protein ACFYD2_09720 [Candidatus Avalokitesvara rifleensis]|uniref:hypothetical protein n=1 Tax=Candidatus Avalokitesvara rifleensis TaxID=3367620 RepID=UPI0027144981|nr:hypothetical protein [Candidatus Brocadiales bacterium]